VVAELVPGFFVGGPATGWAGGVEQDGALFGDDDAFCRDDVPEVFGDDVNGEEIEVSALVAAAGGADVAFVASLGAAGCGGLNLDADAGATEPLAGQWNSRVTNLASCLPVLVRVWV
jgi:hypothetical protein